ncbi:uncharacterized protein LOC144740075, partial [Lampetra planeri]
MRPAGNDKGTVKLRVDFKPKHSDDTLQKKMNCTACGKQVNQFQRSSVYEHPVLKVLICKSCYQYYTSDDISRDSDGMDEQCRWCAEGGKLICCDYCNNAFCKKCILRNLGRRELSTITDENSKWHCYVCRAEPLKNLVSKCHSVMEKKKLETLKPRKADKTEERDNKRHKSKADKEHKSVVNGKEHTEGSGTITFSYKKIEIPKDLLKKAKKLVETTTGLNNTFIQFIQQAAEEQEDKSVRYRHLKAFKAVLADLKKAHRALEEALEPELNKMDLQNGNEGQHILRKSTSAAPAVEKGHKDDVANEIEAVEEPDEKQPEEPDEEQDGELDEKEHETDDEHHKIQEELDEVKHEIQQEQPEPDEEQHEVNDEEGVDEEQEEAEKKQELDNMCALKESAMKDSQTETIETKIIKTEVCDDDLLSRNEMSLDHDIMAVPPSVPEELFQMVESLADSAMLLQTDNNSVTDTDTKSNGNSPDSQHSRPKVKNLIVKLTPVPVVTTCRSRTSRSKNKEKDEEMLKHKEEMKDDPVDAGDGTNSPPPSRRSSRVKTTPLRKQAEDKGKDSSESETEEDSKGNTKSPRRSTGTQPMDGEQSQASSSKKKTSDSDSDEVPDILLEKAAECHSTDEEEGSASAKKRSFKLNNVSSQATDKVSKRKRKSENSDSDAGNKGSKTSKKSKRNGSDSSNSDDDKDTNSKVGAGKRRSTRVKKQDKAKEDGKNSPERKAADRRRSYEKKRKGKHSSKVASKLQLSSSEDEEVEQAEEDSGEDSDQQKIKPIVEDNLVGGGGNFHQSSGDEMAGGQDDIDDLENRLFKKSSFPFPHEIAKKMLLAQIKSSLSSESSSDNEGEEKGEEKSSKTVQEAKDDDDDDEDDDNDTEDNEDSKDSGSDVEVKKSGRRHKLLRHKLSLSEAESGDEKAARKDKNTKGAKTKSDRRRVDSDGSTDSEFKKSPSSAESGVSEELSESENDGGKRRKT